MEERGPIPLHCAWGICSRLDEYPSLENATIEAQPPMRPRDTRDFGGEMQTETGNLNSKNTWNGNSSYSA
jgi:hypothetical protein